MQKAVFCGVGGSPGNDKRKREQDREKPVGLNADLIKPSLKTSSGAKTAC